MIGLSAVKAATTNACLNVAKKCFALLSTICIATKLRFQQTQLMNSCCKVPRTHGLSSTSFDMYSQIVTYVFCLLLELRSPEFRFMYTHTHLPTLFHCHGCVFHDTCTYSSNKPSNTCSLLLQDLKRQDHGGLSTLRVYRINHLPLR